MSGPIKRYPWRWYAGLLVLMGFVLPPLCFKWAERTLRPRNYLGWEEGAEFIYFLVAGGIGVLFVAAAIALAGQRSDRAMPAWRASITVALVAVALGLVIWFCISLVGSAASW